jgi:hypothetical protein
MADHVQHEHLRVVFLRQIIDSVNPMFTEERPSPRHKWSRDPRSDDTHIYSAEATKESGGAKCQAKAKTKYSQDRGHVPSSPWRHAILSCLVVDDKMRDLRRQCLER